MAVTAFWYGLGMKAITNKEVDFNSDVIKVSLHLNYTPDQDTHDYWDDVSATEVAATGGYATGGTAIGTPSLTYTGATNVLMLDGNNVTWPSSTISATHAIVYDSTPGAASTNPLLGYVVFGGTVSSTAGDFTITWGTAGILTITPA